MSDPQPSSRSAETGQVRRFPLRIHLTALALYTLLALVLTWPLIARLTTHVPGMAQWAFDESTFIWNIWYLQHALVENLSSPLHSELIWYPLGIDLILYTYNFFHALIAQPLAWAVNLAFASNVALLFSTVMSGYGVFLLLRYLLNDRQTFASKDVWIEMTLVPFVGGLLYAFASNRAVYAALGHYDMVTTQWIPFYVLMLLRALDGRLTPVRRHKAAALAGLFFAFNGLAEMITALFLAIFTAIVLLVFLVQRLRGNPESRLPSWKSWLTSLAIVGGVALVVWSPALIPILSQFLGDDFSLQGWGEAIPLSVDALGFGTPSALHPLFSGDLVTELRRVQLRALELGEAGFRDVNTVFLGWVSLILAVVGGLTYRSRAAVWIWTTLVFGLFSLGPFLQINGQYRFDLDGVEATLPMPYALLHYLPIIKANRAPNRNSVLLMLGLAVLAAYGLNWLLQRLAQRGQIGRNGRSHAWRNTAIIVGCALGVLILFEHLSAPLPLTDARVPAVYAEIAADPRAGSVLNVPLGWRNSFGVFGAERTQLQYYQTVHGKPMLGGNISRAPDYKMDYFEQIPFFDALAQIQFGEQPSEELLQKARAQADGLMYLYDTGYVVLHPPIPQRFPYADHWQKAQVFVKEILPLENAPFWSDDGIEAYRVAQPAGSDQFELNLGLEGTFAYRGEGWDESEVDEVYGAPAIWATTPTSRLFLPLRQIDPAGEYLLRVSVHPFAYAGSPSQGVSVEINGTELATQTLVDEWQTVEWQIPGDSLVDGLNRLTFRWAHTAAPREVLGGDRLIGSTGVELPVDVDLKAFADGGFIALFDEAGEQTDASAGRQGVNVTVLDGESGEVLEVQGFDTTANAYESQTLVEFLRNVEPGQPVLVVSHGDATAFLTEEAIVTLRNIGADVQLDDLAGQQFALIGVQGAEPGTAVAVVDPVEAFLRLSLNRDRRTLAGAVDWVEIRPAAE